MRTYLVLYLAMAQLAVAPLLAVVWPTFRRWYLGKRRWLVAQMLIVVAAFIVVAVRGA